MEACKNAVIADSSLNEWG